MTERDDYVAAWQQWKGAPEDMTPHWAPRADGQSGKAVLARSKADSGPRRTPAAVDPVASVARAFTAEACDGLALTLALTAAFRGLTRADVTRARRALAQWERTAAAAVMAPMLNAETTPAIDGLAGAYRWMPETCERTTDGRIVPWNESGPLRIDRGHRAAGQWRRFARRHGWETGARADVREGASDRANQALVKRAADGLAEARRMLAEACVPAEAPGRGRPPVWATALAVLLATGEIEESEVPAWVLARRAPDPAVETHWALALQGA